MNHLGPSYPWRLSLHNEDSFSFRQSESWVQSILNGLIRAH
ncbi:hypothetical protein EV13_2965 [Prochlorococcus sp. MIT 0702]|nr:hypothetical protein EV13_2965 [Prochlorococcus sp. MIT 0702]